MAEDNGIKTDKKPIRDERGLFIEGTKPGPGRPGGQKNYMTLIEESLQKEAEKAGKTYWDKLAEWCFKNPSVAVAILKKFVPDKTSTELTMPEPIKAEFIIRENAED